MERHADSVLSWKPNPLSPAQLEDNDFRVLAFMKSPGSHGPVAGASFKSRFRLTAATPGRRPRCRSRFTRRRLCVFACPGLGTEAKQRSRPVAKTKQDIGSQCGKKLSRREIGRASCRETL